MVQSAETCNGTLLCYTHLIGTHIGLLTLQVLSEFKDWVEYLDPIAAAQTKEQLKSELKSGSAEAVTQDEQKEQEGQNSQPKLDEDVGVFYFNKRTKACTWARPEEFKPTTDVP